MGEETKPRTTAESIPTIYQVANKVAEQLQGKPIRHIIINSEMNASYAEYGLKSEPVLTLGLPLLAILSERQQLALIAHEVAHGVNGDPVRGAFVGSAINTLTETWNLLMPTFPPEDFWAYLAQGAMRLLAYIPLSLAFVLAHLFYHDSQAAEYRADLLAAKLCGKEETLSMLDTMHRSEAFGPVVQRAAIGNQTGAFIDTLRDAAASMPASEVERIRRIVELYCARLDSTHPPTTYRMKFIAKHASEVSSVVVSEPEMKQFEEEMRSLEQKIERELVDRYRNSLFYG